MKIVISYKGNSYQTEISKEKEPQLYGLKIGDQFDGAIVGASGYVLKVTGGSDKDGFPMKADLLGGGRRRILLSPGVGFPRGKKGERIRRLVRGNTVTEAIAQLNVIVMKEGPTPLDQIFPPKEKKEEKKS
ncbi:MAG: 30S ribosomal protein S6e [Candidatus Micrarchaeota archaeon]|nr:30S ribosomal protein S6e [Candidatus Micrarchaeota archaeon]